MVRRWSVRKWVIFVFCIVNLIQVVSAEQSELKSQLLASTCAACHGTNGHSVGGLPSLAGLAPEYIIEQMEQFSSGQRVSTVMSHHSRGYTKQEVKLLAEYFSKQNIN